MTKTSSLLIELSDISNDDSDSLANKGRPDSRAMEYKAKMMWRDTINSQSDAFSGSSSRIERSLIGTEDAER